MRKHIRLQDTDEPHLSWHRGHQWPSWSPDLFQHIRRLTVRRFTLCCKIRWLARRKICKIYAKKRILWIKQNSLGIYDVATCIWIILHYSLLNKLELEVFNLTLIWSHPNNKFARLHSFECSGAAKNIKKKEKNRVPAVVTSAEMRSTSAKRTPKRKSKLFEDAIWSQFRSKYKWRAKFIDI